MNVAEINMTWCGSTGRIMLSIAEELRKNGADARTYSPRELNRNEPDIPMHTYYGTYLGRKLHNLFGRVTGLNGLGSIIDTIGLVRMLRKNGTDVLHLHNLHSYCINFPILFRYIRKDKIKVVWTLHDCWTFTGHCPHYDMIGCGRWKTGCGHCPQKREYPQGRFDTSRIMYALKKKWFCGIDDMTLVTPSKWLAAQVGESFLASYPVRVIPNGIDLSVYHPTDSGFRQKHGIPAEKKIILGVAFAWSDRKGFDVFIEMAHRLSEKEYQIVLVGTDEKTEKLLPESVIAVRRTQDPSELAGIYTAADVFANPTREDTFPTVNMEARACGTPVVTFETGGSPETVTSECGAVVPRNDIDAMERELIRICRDRPFDEDLCRIRAQRFGNDRQMLAYRELLAEKGGNA